MLGEAHVPIEILKSWLIKWMRSFGHSWQCTKCSCFWIHFKWILWPFTGGTACIQCSWRIERGFEGRWHCSRSFQIRTSWSHGAKSSLQWWVMPEFLRRPLTFEINTGWTYLFAQIIATSKQFTKSRAHKRKAICNDKVVQVSIASPQVSQHWWRQNQQWQV